MSALAELLGGSPAIVAARSTVERLLRSAAASRRLTPILIQGETGTGKGLLAHAIHRGSARAAGPFVTVNCVAIPETLLESELFGFEKGAFTDARAAKPGLFQTVHRGSLLLDEVGLLTPPLQAKLLTALDERAVRRLGSTRPEPFDVQLIAATNEDLAAAMRARRFREDLYHRLSAVTITLPPLRERAGDIELLAEPFLRRACAEHARPAKRLTPEARAPLARHPWPGNVRELANVLERAALLAEGAELDVDALGLAPVPAAEAPGLDEVVGSVERGAIEAALEAEGGNISRASARRRARHRAGARAPRCQMGAPSHRRARRDRERGRDAAEPRDGRRPRAAHQQGARVRRPGRRPDPRGVHVGVRARARRGRVRPRGARGDGAARVGRAPLARGRSRAAPARGARRPLGR
ncbi:MAG: hypothetical protein FJZ38_22090, partial [Candidatus Rokubacteria bacterium]|nr:hypothetical protein [Candidatus Rokubacteria bacterium]